MEKIKILIVDNETSTIESLENIIKKLNNVEICGVCRNGKKAVDMIVELEPHIVMLDIELPDLNGFEIIKNVKGIDNIYWIFVTAYNNYAVKAFEFNVSDYILKPIKHKRIIKAIYRAINSLNDTIIIDSNSFPHKNSFPEYLSKLLVKDAKNYLLINIDEIYYFRASGNYIKVHLKNDKYLIRSTLKYLESKLDPAKFHRIHNSTIVNFNYVQSFEQWFTGDFEVSLDNGEKLKMSRNYKDVLEYFK